MARLREMLRKGDRVMDKVDNGCRLCVMGDQNGLVGDRVGVGITGAFGVSG